MNTKSLVTLLLIGVLVLVGTMCLFTVGQHQRGLLLRFGEIVQDDLEAGLHYKLPWEEPRLFDGRVLSRDLPPEEYLTLEKKRLIVDSFVMWRISDVSKFFTSTGGGLESQAQALISPRVNEGLRNKFGERSVSEVVSGEREELMVQLTEEINKDTREELGIEIMDVRVKRIDLPANVSGSVYQRMRAEREREAREHRSQGNEQAEGVRADADRQRTVILATAFSQAEQVRGEGDAESAAIYANAYNEDKKFYGFYRSMQSYRTVFKDKSDVLVVEPKGEFFEFMKNPKQ
ncbi:HflC protein [Gammaproteobacteria bacterium 45_16_T64]|nr:HflC protein [Gammaproteobacteria bacterium 45_16_T64]